MDTRRLSNIRSTIYSTEAMYTRSYQIADLQWRIGFNHRFEIYYTNAAGWSAVHVLGHHAVMNAGNTDWLTAELAADGITLSPQEAERIVQQYAIATTAKWHPLLPKLIRALPTAA